MNRRRKALLRTLAVKRLREGVAWFWTWQHIFA